MSLLSAGDRAILEYTPPKTGPELKRQRRDKNRAAAKIKPGVVLSGSIIEVNPLFVVVELPEGMDARN